MASLEITFERNSSEFTVTVEGLPNDVSDAEATDAAEVLKVADIVERNLSGPVNVSSVVVISRRTV
jgi:hypothetical protein